MHFKKHTTALQAARETSLKEFIENHDSANLLDAPNDYLVDGAPLVKCLPSSTSVNQLLTYGCYTTSYEMMRDSNANIRVAKHFMGSLTESIINIKDAGNYKKCIETLHGLHSSFGGMLYGALLISGKTILNPFHPLTAMLMADEEKYKKQHEKNYRIAIYSFKDEGKYNQWHTEFYSRIADKKYIDKNLNALIQVTAHQVSTEVKIIGSEESRNNDERITLKYQISKHLGEDPDYEFYLSAHQMLTSGIVLPWYGTSFIKLNGDTSGCHISPMRSCNLDAGEMYKPGTTPAWSSVCTGAVPKNTLKGLRTLNHANLLSPYNKYIMAPGCLVYAQMAIIKSLQIYRSAGLIKGTLNEETYLTPEIDTKDTSPTHDDTDSGEPNPTL